MACHVGKCGKNVRVTKKNIKVVGVILKVIYERVPFVIIVKI